MEGKEKREAAFRRQRQRERPGWEIYKEEEEISPDEGIFCYRSQRSITIIIKDHHWFLSKVSSTSHAHSLLLEEPF